MQTGQLSCRLCPIGSSRKGQVLVFQHTMLFTIAVGIFILLFAVFNIYSTYYNSTAARDQIKTVRDVLLANIIKLAEKDGDSSAVVDLPKRIGDEEYIMELSQAGLNITTTRTSTNIFSGLYGINETFALSGRAASGKGQVIIFKTAGTIIIN
ncbi:MAG: hypothetical protein HY367_00425 [Candidatus Aenigmarchaeota archaeon]|nr:hypothetical protein [Candidatus Aenigmarchaeota archaeon]